MIIKNIGKPIDITYDCGNFFINEDGELRRIIEVGNNEFGVQNVKNGTLAIGNRKNSIDELIKHYVTHNGNIKKVEVKEINYVEVR
jgi:hypothetical protein